MSALKRLLGRRKLAVLVGVALIPLAGIAVAAVIVAVTTTVTSTAYAGEGLGLALIDASSPGDCLTATYEDSVVLTPPNFDLSSSSNQDVGKELCVKNDGFIDMPQLTVTALASNSIETQCSSAESTAEGGGCGSDGELEDVIQFNFQLLGGGSPTGASCSPTSVSDGTSGSMAGGMFFDGDICVFEVSLSLQAGATEQQKTAASQDAVDFALNVEGTTGP